MSIDLSQFHQVFYEESYEGLQAMEQGLLDMDVDNVDDEVINTIFRAAHSIKGGSGTFGFNQVAEFTHVLETLLDEIRSGDRKMQRSYVDLLLLSVDCLQALLQSLQAGDDPDLSTAKDLKRQFDEILTGEAESKEQSASTSLSAPPPEPPTSDASDGGNEGSGWKIVFKPNQDMLQTGNEPVRMFRQLSELSDGQLEVIAFDDNLPKLVSLNPEYCYLHWVVTINTNVTRAAIDEVFEWVIDDAEVIITPLGKGTSETSSDDETSIVADESTTPPANTPPANTPPANTPPAADKKAATKAKPAAAQESSSIRVGIDKVDSLINMVGELVITQSMLGELGRDFDISRIQRLQEGLAQLEHNTRELQESVMKIRMMPISFVFSRFPRLVRDVSKALDKEIELVMTGENTEMDKTVMEKIGDPMVHLVRNSVDHGIEKPEVRIAAGKPAQGTVNLNAFHQSGNIIIEIKDDGAGLNTEKILKKAKQNGLVPLDAELNDDQIFDLIFQPGFSTADEVSDLSGRGVGMDVVRRNIAALNGSIEVNSTIGKGSQFIIRLPLTLAILDGQLVRVGEEIFIFPLVSIVESIQQEESGLNNVAGQSDVMQLRHEYVPIVHLEDAFNIANEPAKIDERIIVVVETDGEKMGVVVDELLGQQQVVIKSLEQNYRKVDGISGATILGDGTVALIIDISGLAKMSGTSVKHVDNGSAHKAA